MHPSSLNITRPAPSLLRRVVGVGSGRVGDASELMGEEEASVAPASVVVHEYRPWVSERPRASNGVQRGTRPEKVNEAVRSTEGHRRTLLHYEESYEVRDDQIKIRGEKGTWVS